GGTVTALTVLSSIWLVWLLLLAYRMAPLGGDLTRVAHYFRTSWKLDKADLRRRHALSLRDVSLARAELTLKIAMVALSVLLGSTSEEENNSASAVNKDVGVSAFLLSASLLMLLGCLWRPPYHFLKANCVRAGLWLTVCYTNGVAIVVQKSEIADVTVTVLHLIGSVVVFALGVTLMSVRCTHWDILRPQQDVLHDQWKHGYGAAFSVQSDAEHTREDDLMFCDVCGSKVPRDWWTQHQQSVKHVQNLDRQTGFARTAAVVPRSKRRKELLKYEKKRQQHRRRVLLRHDTEIELSEPHTIADTSGTF
ncbi:MAG: hypothetical protein MHM6MM_003768, partial [Cercozoa sp. M6MM]